MKALTLIQPWATLIIDGCKTIETRSWSTKVRGTIAIHAGKKVDREAAIKFGYNPDKLPTGCVIGIVDIIGCVQFDNKTTPDPYGDFMPGRFGFVLDNPRSFQYPVDERGALGFWNWDDKKAVKVRLRPEDM
jgi:hypothetical protein